MELVESDNEWEQLYIHSMACSKDDSGTCCGRCLHNVIAVVPCFGRFPLLRLSVERLIKKNRVKVLLVGHEPEVEKIAKETNSYFLHYPNTKLGEKWNAGFQYARQFKPDAVLFVGSSDWLSDNWVDVSVNQLGNYDMVGTLGCHLLDIRYPNKKRLVYWPGYGEGERENEPIGIGRLISARALDKMDWQPFDSHKDNSMDWQMWQKVLRHGKVKIMDDNQIKSMAISTNKWPNKHRFEEHWVGPLKSIRMEPEPFISKYFPESNNIFK